MAEEFPPGECLAGTRIVDATVEARGGLKMPLLPEWRLLGQERRHQLAGRQTNRRCRRAYVPQHCRQTGALDRRTGWIVRARKLVHIENEQPVEAFVAGETQ